MTILYNIKIEIAKTQTESFVRGFTCNTEWGLFKLYTVYKGEKRIASFYNHSDATNFIESLYNPQIHT